MCIRDSIWQTYERIKKKNIREWDTPGYPGTTLVKGDHEEELDGTNYRHIVGKAMFWNQKIGIECNNATRELSRFMQKPGPEHWKALERYCGYLKQIPFDRLRYRAPKRLQSITYFDSNFAHNPDDRLSVTGIHETLDDAGVVHTTSQGQKVIAKSSSEAEYMAGSHAADGMVFTTNLINELLGQGTMMKPGLLCGDNQGSLFLMNNLQVGQRTKHIDIRAHWIRRLIRNKNAKTKYVKSEDLVADIDTKNTDAKTFIRHAKVKRGLD